MFLSDAKNDLPKVAERLAGHREGVCCMKASHLASIRAQYLGLQSWESSLRTTTIKSTSYYSRTQYWSRYVIIIYNAVAKKAQT